MSSTNETILDLRAARDKLAKDGYACVLIAVPVDGGEGSVLITNVDEAMTVDICSQVIGNIENGDMQENPPPGSMLN